MTKLKQELLTILFARQEIYNLQGSVCAYELLYRSGDINLADFNSADEVEGDKATSLVLSHLFTQLDIDNVIGRHTAFINFTRNHILKKIPNLLPKERVVIELLENIVVDDLLLDTLRHLRKIGYKFALDDFVYKEDFEALIKFADIIKIDVLGFNEQQLQAQLKPLAGFKGTLLAEKIETHEQFELCKKLGFHLFQGYFLHHPKIVEGKALTENKTYLLRLFSELYDPQIKIERIEEIVLLIPKLSYRILRLANSVSLYLGKKIESLMDAIQQLGLVQIRNWVSLLLLSTLDDVSHDLLERTFIRAKMCQNLASRSKLALPHQAYTVGMLSTIDAILNEPMASLLSKIQLSEELNVALLIRDGNLGLLLKMTELYELGQFDQLNFQKLSNQDYSQAYLEGIAYANEVMNLLD